MSSFKKFINESEERKVIGQVSSKRNVVNVIGQKDPVKSTTKDLEDKSEVEEAIKYISDMITKEKAKGKFADNGKIIHLTERLKQLNMKR